MLVIGILEASGVLKVSFPIWHVPLVFSYGEILLKSTCSFYVTLLGPCLRSLFLEEGFPEEAAAS